MRPPCVAESRLAFEPEAYGPPYGPHDANDLVCLLAAAHVLDRHEVDHFADPLGAKKARQQHVAVGQVHLLVLGLIEARDLGEASFALIENRGEDAWRVELRKATPVDRTVHAHQRDRVQVADDAVGLDRLIGHFGTRISKSGMSCEERHQRAGARHHALGSSGPAQFAPDTTGTSFEEGSMPDRAGDTLPLLNVSIRTVCRHFLAKARVCLMAAVWGDHYGGNYGQAPE